MSDPLETIRKLKNPHDRSLIFAKIVLLLDCNGSTEVIGSHNCRCVLPQMRSNGKTQLRLSFELYEKRAKSLEISK